MQQQPKTNDSRTLRHQTSHGKITRYHHPKTRPPMRPYPSEFEEFINRSHRLEKSAFWKWLTTPRGQADIPKFIEGNWLASDGLNQDELEAFCLNLRLFIQDGDGFSIRKIKELSEKWSDTHLHEKTGIKQATDTLRKSLDEPSFVSIYKDKPTTNEDIFDVIFYGGIVHSNPSKRATYNDLVKSGLFSYFVFSAFSSTLFHYRNCIQTIAHHLARHVVHEYGNEEDLQHCLSYQRTQTKGKK
ncbi:hypothetical protein [Comamonas testosteroni]|uniref:hypothetical protein n=1 Tax=Comamonas testosteroni TaxID=285 RepID=UPI000AAA415A|nr:hypothetical protein [Comamonas testosteroni]